MQIQGFNFFLSPDRETKAVYVETVTVSDGNYTAQQEIRVDLNDINDSSPTVYDIPSNGILNTIEHHRKEIAEFTARDDDDTNTTYTWTLSGQDGESFELVSTDGNPDVTKYYQLKSKEKLDYETKSEYSIVMNLSDGTNTTQYPITVQVIDAPDHIGSDLRGPDIREMFGGVTKISEDGTTVAVIEISKIRIYRWQNSDWAEIASWSLSSGENYEAFTDNC